MLCDDLEHLRLAIGAHLLGRLELWQRDQLVVSMAVADVGGKFDVNRVRALRLLERKHAVVETEVAEEDHIINHEAEEWTQFILRRQHELLRLVLHDRIDLLLNLAGLLEYEVHPRELFFNTVVEVRISGRVRVSVEDVDGEPAGRVELDDLQGAATRRHGHPPRHQLELLAGALPQQVQVH